VSPDILHKSDIGGVRLDVGVDDVEAAFHEVIEAGRKVAGARVDGVMISPMVGAGAELLVGIVRDEQWGPMLAIAIGGIFVEILNDSALASVPVSPRRVKEMLKSLKGFGLLDGARGVVPADLDSLSRTIADIGDLAVQLGEQLEGLEINPLWVSGTEIYALDAAITLAPLSGSARGHQTEPVSSGAKDAP
jgi:succinyl-CoA synthetase beta subunit